MECTKTGDCKRSWMRQFCISNDNLAACSELQSGYINQLLVSCLGQVPETCLSCEGSICSWKHMSKSLISTSLHLVKIILLISIQSAFPSLLQNISHLSRVDLEIQAGNGNRDSPLRADEALMNSVA